MTSIPPKFRRTGRILKSAAAPASPESTGPKEPANAAQVASAGGNGAPTEKKYVASIYPDDPGECLPTELVKVVRDLEAALKLPVWLLIQNPSGMSELDSLNDELERAFLATRHDLPVGKPIALVVHSLGGIARSAYKIASVLRRRCGEFVVLVPDSAKSAATLLTLGASRIILGDHAELGPLDAQLIDDDREEVGSALDEVQALDRLHSFAVKAIDQEMALYTRRSGKKVSSLLPDVQRFVASFMQPLLQKIDTVHYTQMSRILKVAEEYAVRLLQTKYGQDKAEHIANRLVHSYPEHGFVIDLVEATRIGLAVEAADPETSRLLDRLLEAAENMTVIGCLMEAAE
jgi:hypothetical protein